jgi:hypothetical protein
MIITPFGDMDFNDLDTALPPWVDAHAQTHRGYAQTFALAGISYQNGPLTGEIDRDWFGRHMLEHVAIEQALQGQENAPDSSPDIMLGFGDWSRERPFYDWHQIHNDSHARIDQALGISEDSF